MTFFPETSLEFERATRRHILEDSDLHKSNLLRYLNVIMKVIAMIIEEII